MSHRGHPLALVLALASAGVGCGGDPAGSISFEPDVVVATRTPVHASCDEVDAPFTDDDVFSLQGVRTLEPRSRVRSIALQFHRTVTLGTPLPLLDGPGGDATFEGAQQAHSAHPTTGVDLVVFAAGERPGVSPFRQATVTVLDVAARDGQPVRARVELEFVDGETLDEELSALLVSYEGACG